MAQTDELQVNIYDAHWNGEIHVKGTIVESFHAFKDEAGNHKFRVPNSLPPGFYFFNEWVMEWNGHELTVLGSNRA